MDEQIEPATPLYGEPEKNSKKKIVIAGITAALVVVISLVLYLALRNKAAEAPRNNLITPENSTTDAKSVNQNFVEAINKLSATDADLDGLADSEETKYGTDPHKADTDGDGLLDKDEITIYKTDPRKADTYGFGMSDGKGVRQGIILPDGKHK